MTFKDKFTNKFNPFEKKKKTEMAEAWGWGSLFNSLPPLPHGLETL